MAEEYNFDTLFNGVPFNMSIAGSTGSGKSILLYYLLYKYSKEYDFVYFLTASRKYEGNSELNNYIWPNHIKRIDKKDFLINICDDLTKWLERVKESSDSYPKTLIITDDMGDNIRKGLYNFINKSRHSNISCIFLLHSMKDLNPGERNQIRIKVFTKMVENVKNELDITDPKLINTIRDQIYQIFDDTLETKKYCISEDDKIYYYIIPLEIVNDLKYNKINILHYHESLIKDNIRNSIAEILPSL